MGGPQMSLEWLENFCECYYNPRVWDKTLAVNVWETFLFGPILGHPTLPCHFTLHTLSLLTENNHSGTALGTLTHPLLISELWG